VVNSFHKVAKIYPLWAFAQKSLSLEWVLVKLGLKLEGQMGWRGFESLQPRPEFKTEQPSTL